MTPKSGIVTSLILTLLVVALALLAVDASANIFSEGALTPARTDGKGAIAWFARPGLLHVRDTSAEAQYDIDLSGECTTPPTSLIAVGGGMVLFTCSVPHAAQYRTVRDEPRLLDVARRTIVVPAGAGELLDQFDDDFLGAVHFTGIGAHGLRYMADTYHSEYNPGTIDWRTGTTVPGDGTERSVPDLDSPTSLTTLCEPLRQRIYDKHDPDDHFGQPSWDPYLYEQPYGVLEGPRTDLTLERCGSTQQTVLEPWVRRRSRAVDAQLSSGFVTWFVIDPTEVPVSLSALRAYLPECGLRLAWELPPGSSVAHLSGRIVWSEPSRLSEGRWTVQTTPVTTMCRRTAAIWTARIAHAGQHQFVPATSGSFRFTNHRMLATRQATPTARRPPLVLDAGRDIRIGFGATLRSLRWRIGGGRWRAVAVEGADAHLRAPAVRGDRVLQLDGRFRREGRVRVEIPVVAG